MNVAYNGLIENNNNSDHVLYQIYNDLMIPYFTINTNRKMTLMTFNFLLNALEKPVLTTEVNIIIYIFI